MASNCKNSFRAARGPTITLFLYASRYGLDFCTQLQWQFMKPKASSGITYSILPNLLRGKFLDHPISIVHMESDVSGEERFCPPLSSLCKCEPLFSRALVHVETLYVSRNLYSEETSVSMRRWHQWWGGGNKKFPSKGFVENQVNNSIGLLCGKQQASFQLNLYKLKWNQHTRIWQMEGNIIK